MVATFLMRCLFTMFAQPVKLLPARDTFSELLDTCHAAPSKFVPLIGELWRMMNTGGFSFTGQETIRCFSGGAVGPVTSQAERRPTRGTDWKRSARLSVAISSLFVWRTAGEDDVGGSRFGRGRDPGRALKLGL